MGRPGRLKAEIAATPSGGAPIARARANEPLFVRRKKHIRRNGLIAGSFRGRRPGGAGRHFGARRARAKGAARLKPRFFRILGRL